MDLESQIASMLEAGHTAEDIERALKLVLERKKQEVRVSVNVILEKKGATPEGVDTVLGSGRLYKPSGSSTDYTFYPDTLTLGDRTLPDKLFQQYLLHTEKGHLCVPLENGRMMYIITCSDSGTDGVGRPNKGQLYIVETDGNCLPIPAFHQVTKRLRDAGEAGYNRGKFQWTMGEKFENKVTSTHTPLAPEEHTRWKNRVLASISCDVGLETPDIERVDGSILPHTAGIALECMPHTVEDLQKILGIATQKPLIRNTRRGNEPLKNLIQSLEQKLGNVDGHMDLLTDAGLPSKACAEVVRAYTQNDFTRLTKAHEAALPWLKHVLNDETFATVRTQITKA